MPPSAAGMPVTNESYAPVAFALLWLAAVSFPAWAQPPAGNHQANFYDPVADAKAQLLLVMLALPS